MSININITDRNDNLIQVYGEPGISVMELIRKSGVNGFLALCGGGCSCATCHIYIDENWMHEVPPISDDEDALLDTSDHRKNNSRLSCQIKINHKHDGMRIMIAPQD